MQISHVIDFSLHMNQMNARVQRYRQAKSPPLNQIFVNTRYFIVLGSHANIVAKGKCHETLAATDALLPKSLSTTHHNWRP
jgi:hypothetical protein